MPKDFYEKGFYPKTEIGKGNGGTLEYMGDAEPGYLEGHNSSPKMAKYNYEAEGEGSKGPAAK